MMERHYFRGHLLKSFDFDFGFRVPNGGNSCGHIYEFLQLCESTGKSSKREGSREADCCRTKVVVFVDRGTAPPSTISGCSGSAKANVLFITKHAHKR